MSKRPFVLGVSTGLALTVAMGFGALMWAGAISAAGTSLRLGDAVRGALARRDASPATGALVAQANEDDMSAEADETGADEADRDASAAMRTLPARKMFRKARPSIALTHARAIHLGDEPGVLVAGVDPEGAAAAAGLARGNVITAIDGEAVDHLADLHERLAEREAGETVTLSVTHGDEARELTVTLDEDEKAGLLGFAPCGGGMMAFPVPEVLELHEFGSTDGEAVVAGVEEGSGAEAAGLDEGDVITAVDGAEVEGSAALAELIGSRAPGETVSLSVRSADDETREVEATLGAHPEDPERAFLGVMLGHSITIESGMLPEGLPGGGHWFDHEGMLPFEWHGEDGLSFEFGEDMAHFEMDAFEGLEALAVDGRLEGAVVHGFTEEGPASEAGLAGGDLITAIDGQAIDGAEALVEALSSRAPGETVALTVARKGESDALTFEATLGARPDDEAAGWLGVEVGTVQVRFDGEGGIDVESHIGGLRDHLRQMLRGEGDERPTFIIKGEEGLRRFRLRMAPGGVEHEAPPAVIEIDRSGEA